MQLTLNISIQEDLTLKNFFWQNNEVLEKTLMQLLSTDETLAEKRFYLWATEGQGKSHLLQALSNEYLRQGKTSIYLPLKQIKEYGPQTIEGIEELDLVCLDDIDAIAGCNDWEISLFNLYNNIRERNGCLIISGRTKPQQLGIQLLDLVSRLTWEYVFKINELGDDKKIILLQKRALERGLELPNSVGQYLLKRYSRNMRALIELLDKLDKASLAYKRKLTIPFVKEILNN